MSSEGIQSEPEVMTPFDQGCLVLLDMIADVYAYSEGECAIPSR